MAGDVEIGVQFTEKSSLRGIEDLRWKSLRINFATGSFAMFHNTRVTDRGGHCHMGLVYTVSSAEVLITLSGVCASASALWKVEAMKESGTD